MVLTLDGETIVRADPHIGLLHRATEKLIENKTYTQVITELDFGSDLEPANNEKNLKRGLFETIKFSPRNSCLCSLSHTSIVWTTFR